MKVLKNGELTDQTYEDICEVLQVCPIEKKISTQNGLIASNENDEGFLADLLYNINFAGYIPTDELVNRIYPGGTEVWLMMRTEGFDDAVLECLAKRSYEKDMQVRLEKATDEAIAMFPILQKEIAYYRSLNL